MESTKRSRATAECGCGNRYPSRRSSCRHSRQPLRRSGTHKSMTSLIATFRPGDVVVVPFPFTDREAAQRRPTLVCSLESYNRDARHLVLAMITTMGHDAWPPRCRPFRPRGGGIDCAVNRAMETVHARRLIRYQSGGRALRARSICVSRRATARTLIGVARNALRTNTKPLETGSVVAGVVSSPRNIPLLASKHEAPHRQLSLRRSRLPLQVSNLEPSDSESDALPVELRGIRDQPFGHHRFWRATRYRPQSPRR